MFGISDVTSASFHARNFSWNEPNFLEWVKSIASLQNATKSEEALASLSPSLAIGSFTRYHYPVPSTLTGMLNQLGPSVELG